MRLSILLCLCLFFCLETYSQKYVMVWNDEFNKPGLPDSTKWDFLNQKGYNDELQYYTRKESKNAWIKDTTLIIELRKEPYLTANYTSAMLVSKFKGDWQYGKFEIRAKVPTGKGTWPAIWMMPSNDEYGGWPKSGEIDIMEYVGWDASKLYYTIHYEGTNGTGHQSSGVSTYSPTPYNRFITFTLVWSPGKIEWYEDNKLVHSYTKSSDDHRVWPFNKMFYMILNLAYGGWGGQQGIDDTKLPHKFYVDYVRVYQMQESTGPFSINVQPLTGGTVEISPKMDSYPEGTPVTVTAIPDKAYEFNKWLYTGAANPIQLTVSKDLTLIPLFQKKNELILNGDFTLGLKSWGNLYINNSATMAASSSVTDGLYTINVTKPGTANWHICDQQGNISIEKGVTYNVSFDAWADKPGSMDVYISKNHDDYGGYYSTVKSISTVKQTYTWSFKMAQASDPNCRFGFGFGQFSGKVYMDNVSVTKVVATAVNAINTPADVFELYPNPATNYVDIYNQSDRMLKPLISLYNLQGQLIANLSAGQAIAAGQPLHINLDNISPGIYLVNISTAEKSVTRKIIINPYKN